MDEILSILQNSPMRLVYFVFPVALFFCGKLQAQSSPESGQCSLTLVNALPGPKNLYVKLGAEVIWPPGFTPGQSTGAVLFPPGKKTVELTCEGFARTQTEILMPAGGNFAMIFFPGEEMKEGPDKGKKKIGVYCPPPILPGQPPKGKNWKILLVGPVVQTEVSVNSKSMELKMGQPVEIASEGGRVLVENGNKTLLATSPEGEGNYWAIIFGDSKESLQAAYLNHVAYSVPK